MLALFFFDEVFEVAVCFFEGFFLGCVSTFFDSFPFRFFVNVTDSGGMGATVSSFPGKQKGQFLVILCLLFQDQLSRSLLARLLLVGQLDAYSIIQSQVHKMTFELADIEEYLSLQQSIRKDILSNHT